MDYGLSNCKIFNEFRNNESLDDGFYGASFLNNRNQEMFFACSVNDNAYCCRLSGFAFHQ